MTQPIHIDTTLYDAGEPDGRIQLVVRGAVLVLWLLGVMVSAIALAATGDPKAPQVSLPASQDPDVQVRMQYRFLLEGEKVGTIRTTRKRLATKDQQASAVINDSDMKIEIPEARYALVATSHAVTIGGVIERYRVDTVENGVSSRVVAKRESPAMVIERVVGDKPRRFTVPMSEFDGTTAEFPEGALDAGAMKSLRILDLDEIAIDKVAVKNVGQETIAVEATSFVCRVIEFKGKKERGRRWVAEDSLGFFLVKEMGTSRDGLYAIVLTAYHRE